MWRLDEFLSDTSRGGDREVWQAIFYHDREDVQVLVAALRKSLDQEIA